MEAEEAISRLVSINADVSDLLLDAEDRVNHHQGDYNERQRQEYYHKYGLLEVESLQSVQHSCQDDE